AGQPPAAAARHLEIRGLRPAAGRHHRPSRRLVAAASRVAPTAARRGPAGGERGARASRIGATSRTGAMTRIRDNAGRLVLVGLLALGILAAWHWRGVFDPVGLTELVNGGPAAPLVFLGVHILASLLFVPRTLLALGAGLIFGMWWGALWAALGSLMGAVA